MEQKNSIITFAMIAVILAGAVGYYFTSNSRSRESYQPPRIAINYPKFQGQISGDIICGIPGTHAFTEDKVSSDPATASILQAGIHIYHSDTDIKVQQIIDKIDSVKGNKILIAYYPSNINPNTKFSVYKSFTGQNPLALDTKIPANEGFIIFSCKETKIHGIKTETEFGSALPAILGTKQDTGWVLIAAPTTNVGKEAKDKNKNIKYVWPQQGVDFNFGTSEEAPDAATLKNTYKMVWVEMITPPLIKAIITPDTSPITIDSEGNPPASTSFFTLGVTSDQDVSISEINLKITATSPAKLVDLKNLQITDGSNVLTSAKVSTDSTATLVLSPAYPLVQNSGKKLTIKVNFNPEVIADGGKYTIKIDDIKFSDPSSIIDKTTLATGSTKTASKAAVVAANPPSAPSDIKTFGAIAATYATLQWTAPTNNGGSPITKYKVFYEQGTCLANDQSMNSSKEYLSVNTYATLANLTSKTDYQVRISATNSADFNSNWSPLSTCYTFKTADGAAGAGLVVLTPPAEVITAYDAVDGTCSASTTCGENKTCANISLTQHICQSPNPLPIYQCNKKYTCTGQGYVCQSQFSCAGTKKCTGTATDFGDKYSCQGNFECSDKLSCNSKINGGCIEVKTCE